MPVAKVIRALNRGTFQLRVACPFNSGHEMRVAFAVEQEIPGRALHRPDLTVGGCVSSEYVIGELMLKPQPYAVLVDHGFIDPACSAHLRRLRAEECVGPSAGDVQIALFPQALTVGFPPGLAVIVVVVPGVQQNERRLRRVNRPGEVG